MEGKAQLYRCALHTEVEETESVPNEMPMDPIAATNTISAETPTAELVHSSRVGCTGSSIQSPGTSAADVRRPYVLEKEERASLVRQFAIAWRIILMLRIIACCWGWHFASILSHRRQSTELEEGGATRSAEFHRATEAR